MKKVRIGLIGTGGICNGVHIPGYLSCPDCEITAICDIDPAHLKKTGDRLNIPESGRFTDYKDLLRSGLVDAVDITTSNDWHVPIALDALDAGLPVSVEKPIGMSFDESLALRKKSEETGLPVFVCFSWRYRDCPRYIRSLIEEGKVGDIYHIYIRSIKDSGLWEGRRLEWRFQEDKASSGVLCDLGSHMFDMIRFFGEEFESVSCDRGTVVKRRQLENSEEWGEVTTDDWANVNIVLKSGYSATVQLSRALLTEKDTTEIYIAGSKGGIKMRYENGVQTLWGCFGEDTKTQTFRELTVPEGLVSAGQSSAYVSLLLGNPDPNSAVIHEGIMSQVAVDAAKLSSQTGRRIPVSELFGEV